MLCWQLEELFFSARWKSNFWYQWKLWFREKVLILVKQTQNFAWVYVIIFIIVNIFVNEKEVFKFKADNRNVNFPTQFCLESISNGFITIILVINLTN